MLNLAPVFSEVIKAKFYVKQKCISHNNGIAGISILFNVSIR